MSDLNKNRKQEKFKRGSESKYVYKLKLITILSFPRK